jgi:hypothetical protein
MKGTEGREASRGGASRRWWTGVVAVVVCVVLAAVVALSAAWFLSPHGSGPPRRPDLRTLFEANQTTGYANATGTFANVTIGVVNASVPLSTLIIYPVPLNAAIVPTNSWEVFVYANSSSTVPICTYQLTTNISMSTADAADLRDGMILSAYTPSPVTLVGGYLGFQSTVTESLDPVWIS